MNALQFYYVRTVLGVSSVIQPEVLRSVYRLLNNSAGKADFLFFCDPVKSVEEKHLIQKMAKAIGSSKELILEVLNQTHSEKAMLDNLLTRFLPRGFVIFGANLGYSLINKKITRPVSISRQETLSIPGCVLNPLSDFTGKDSLKIQNTKQQAWNLLKKTFLKSECKEVHYEHNT